MEEQQLEHLKGAVEALLFVSEKPVTIDQLREAVGAAAALEIREALAALEKDYEGGRRGMIVIEIAGGWQMLSSGNYAGYIREFYKTRNKEKLSRPALETLAIIAYKQPVSRTDVEVIRGVNADGVVMHLLNKGLIKIAGRKEVPGRPYVYGTTTLFLEYFGLRSLEDLPKLEEFPGLAARENLAVPTAVASVPEAGVKEFSDHTPVAPGASAVAAAVSLPDEGTEAQRLQSDIAQLENDIDDHLIVTAKATGDSDMPHGETSGQARLAVFGPASPAEQDQPQTREMEHGTDHTAQKD